MHASFAHILKPTGRSWHCEDGPRSILPWLRPSGMYTAVSESDLDHLDKWLRSRTRRPHRKLEPYFPSPSSGSNSAEWRALPAEGRGREFESRRVRQRIPFFPCFIGI